MHAQWRVFPMAAAALFLAQAVVRGADQTPENCRPLSPAALTKLRAYVASRYELAPDVRIEDGLAIEGTCFRRLVFRAAESDRKVELFLSPDQRFLSESLLDTAQDPYIERRRVAQATQAALLSDNSPEKGTPDAIVTMVVFSDFQCSFCKKFADFLPALSPQEAQQTRLVFKQRPLLMHNWARRAALATICASFQGNEFFWPLHDFLFASQNNLTAATLDAAVGRFMERDVQFSADEYRGCMEQHKAEVILQRDEALAESYHVEATPTIFINGVRKMGFGSPDQLRAAIRSAITAAQGRSNGEK